MYVSKYSWENFCFTLDDHEKHKSLAQGIFSRLWLIIETNLVRLSYHFTNC